MDRWCRGEERFAWEHDGRRLDLVRKGNPCVVREHLSLPHGTPRVQCFPFFFTWALPLRIIVSILGENVVVRGEISS